MHFGRDLGAKICEKPMPKQCQKHVAIDLEVEVAKTQKLTPLIAFLMFFQSVFGRAFGFGGIVFQKNGQNGRPGRREAHQGIAKC